MNHLLDIIKIIMDYLVKLREQEFRSYQGSQSRDVMFREEEERLPLHDRQTPNLGLARVWFALTTFRQYAIYLREFYIRNPVMWYLFYRWWFFYPVPQEMRRYLPRLMSLSPGSVYISRSSDFAKYQPVLFLLQLLWGTLLQAGVKCLTKWYNRDHA